MDELKAYALVAAVAVRLWLPDATPLAARGAGGDRYRGRGHQFDHLHATARIRRRDRRRRQPRHRRLRRGFASAAAPVRRSPLALLEALGRFIVHYPSHILFVALAGRIDLFLHAYVVMHAAYAARALLKIARALAPATPTAHHADRRSDADRRDAGGTT